MHRLVSCAALAAALPAQQLCQSWNDDGLLTNLVTTGQTIGIKLTAAKAMSITAAQLHTGLVPGQAAVSIWSHDANANAPDLQLVPDATFRQRVKVSWQGARFAQPLPVAVGEVFWLVWRSLPGSQVSRSSAPGGTLFYRSLVNGNWTGPPLGNGPQPIKARVYGDYPTGTTRRYGAGQAGPTGRVPTIAFGGYPSIGNPIELLLQRATANRTAVLLAGVPQTTALPGIGTLLNTAWVVIPVQTDGGGRTTIEARVPNAVGLRNKPVAFQYWVVESSGFAHTDGLEVNLN